MNPTSNDALSMFSKSCDAGSLRLNFLDEDGRSGEQRSFDPPFYVVGRSPDADLRLDHEDVSWRHCYLQVIGGRLVSIDLDSQTGVLIDGMAQRIGWVTPENHLQIGPVGFRLTTQTGGREGHEAAEASGNASFVHPLSAQYARSLPPAAMEIEGVGGQTYGWRMSRALALIGRSTACQVRLMNPSISKFHAALVRTPTGVWIVDLLSREGIEVDGANVRAARLHEGSVCQVGTFTLRLCCGTLAPAPPRRADRPRSLPVPAGLSETSSTLRPTHDGRTVLMATPIAGSSGLIQPSTWSTNATGAGLATPSELQGSWNPANPGNGDPSQQAMMMLAQMLGTMHRDHMSLVKDELAEIRKLAEEMHALRVEITQRPVQGPAPAAASAPAIVPALGVGDEASEQGLAEAPAQPRDPRECLAIASQFLASYEQKQEGHWSRILRIVTGGSTAQEPRRGPLGQAPLS